MSTGTVSVNGGLGPLREGTVMQVPLELVGLPPADDVRWPPVRMRVVAIDRDSITLEAVEEDADARDGA